MFELIPAIDVLGGRVVRLARGDYAAVTVYGDDPVATAAGFIEEGAPIVHVVDLEIRPWHASRGRLSSD